MDGRRARRAAAQDVGIALGARRGGTGSNRSRACRRSAPRGAASGVRFGLLLLSASLCFGSATIDLAKRELRLRTRLLGLARSRVLRAGEVSRIELHSGMQRGDQVWHDLRLHLAGAGKVTAGSGMTRKEADSLAAEVRRELDVP